MSDDRHQTKPYPLRMTDELRSKLGEAALQSKRSLNAEIVRRLEESFISKSVADLDKIMSREQERVQITRELLAELRAELITELVRTTSKKKS